VPGRDRREPGQTSEPSQGITSTNHRHERPRLDTAEGYRTAIDVHLKRAEDGELHRSPLRTLLRLPRSPQVSWTGGSRSRVNRLRGAVHGA
jgi:hypothetical protein